MSVEMFLQYLAVRLNGPKAADRAYVFDLQFTDLGERYLLEVENGVLNFTKDAAAVAPVPYDPSKPIDLGGIEGVTPAQQAAAENLVAVMSGVGIRRRWKSEASPWYNFFDEIELLPFSQEEAEALVREPVAGVFRWKPEAVERVLELSQLRPYLVQKLCVHAVNHMLEAGRSTIRPEDVDAARTAALSEDPPGASLVPEAAARPSVAD